MLSNFVQAAVKMLGVSMSVLFHFFRVVTFCVMGDLRLKE